MLTRLVSIIALLLLLSGAASAQGLTLTGEVTYRERVALPAGASLYVGLVTVPDGNPVLGAGSSVPAGAQPPLQFALGIRSDLKSSTRSYGLVADIRLGNTILFRSPAPVPVDLHAGAATPIVVSPYSGPQANVEPVIESDLIGTRWQVTSIAGTPAKGSNPITLSIASDLRVDGNAGCNDYFAQASVEGGGLQFGLPASTKKACSPDLMAQEQAFFAALAATASYELSDESMRLLDGADIPLVGLIRAKE